MGQIAELIMRVLNGDSQPEELGPCWRADLMIPIRDRAIKILELPIRERASAIESHCPAVAGLLKAEVTRIHRIRKAKKCAQ